MDIIVKELKPINEILLEKLNGEVIGQIPVKFVSNQSRNFDDIDSLEFEIPRFIPSQIGKISKENPLYFELMTERVISIDDEKFIIKKVKTDDDKEIKTVTVYGYEKKLEKNNFVMSNMGLSLLDKNENDEVESFDEWLYKDTGWHIGYVDDSVRYMENGQPKVRIQEDTKAAYYSFITDTIQEQFCCVPIFDRKNKLVNLFDMDSFGDNLQLILSRDNYIKSKEVTDDSTDIVTRLTLEGNDEKCIVSEVNPTGFDYIEDYSYFMEIGEMSEELNNALIKFEQLTIERTKTWKDKTAKRETVRTELSNKQANENILLAQIEQYENIIKAYEDLETETETYDFTSYENQIQILKDEQAQLSVEIAQLELEYSNLSNDIDKLNILLRRETSTDEKGNLLFTQDLLNELKEYVYCDTYSDDSFIDANELIKTGRQQLKLKSRPTTEFTIDSIDFTNRLIENRFRRNWNGRIGLGDIVALYDKETKVETYLYLVGWQKNYKDNSLSLTFSNKKTNKDSSKLISDVLREAKNNKKIINTNKWLWNNQKYNKVSTDLISDIDLDVAKNPPELTDTKYIRSITLDKTELNLDSDEYYTLTATIVPPNPELDEVFWMSSNERVAIVEGGKVTGLDYGKCVISAVSKEFNKSASCIVTVGDYDETKDVQVTGIRLDTKDLLLDKNETRYLVASVVPTNATNQNLSYYSTDTKIATVSSEGLVTGVSNGTCKINVVSTENTKIVASCLVVVTQKEVSLKYENIKGSLLIGDDRIEHMKESHFLDDLSVYAKSKINANYFSEHNIIDTFPSNPTCVLTMLGINDLTSLGILYYKSLLDKLLIKYPSKDIIVIKELPVAITYKNDIYDYITTNSNIVNFNDEIEKYCTEKSIKTVNVSAGLVIDKLLNTTYSRNGYLLTENGYKILRNNINSYVLDVLNKASEEPEDPIEDDEKGKLSVMRQKIVARAEEIVQLCIDGKAWYSQYNRTVDYNKKQVIKSSYETIRSQKKKKTYKQPGVGKWGFDCSSFVGCCYQAAGLDFMKGLSCAGGTIQDAAKEHNAKAWRYVDTKFENALPGDIVMFANDDVKLTKNNMFTCDTHHTAIYMGDGYIAEAIGYSSGIQKRKRKTNSQWFFFRLEELIKADKKISDIPSDNTKGDSKEQYKNCFNETGTIDGKSYIYRFQNARCTSYGGDGSSGCSIPLNLGKTCGMLNVPYGTKVYVPKLKGKKIVDGHGKSVTCNGIFTVNDCGVGMSDMDIYMSTYSDSNAEKIFGNPIRSDIYVLSWGSGYGTSWSFTQSYKWAYNHGSLSAYKTAFKYYISGGGVLINFTKFKSDDKDIRNSKYWSILNS